MTQMNRQILLAARPQGEATTANFRSVQTAVPAPTEGQVLVRHHYLSLDPYMRGRMNDTRSYAPPQALDAVMIGGTAGVVIESRNARWQVGDAVTGYGGWQEYSIVDGNLPGALQKVDAARAPLSAWLGALGMPGVTAWHGLTRIIAPKAGETVLVSSAAGAVGSVVGQLAKARGCRAVGIAGGAGKCRYVVEELGFDACIDHRAQGDLESMRAALRGACPDGLCGIFENVGGLGLDAALLVANDFARVALCGMIAGYNGVPVPLASPQLLLTRRMRVEGFIVSEHPSSWPPAREELLALHAAGRLKYRESIAQGLENAPDAFIGLLQGRNLGKQLVQLA
ncbi:MAG TPA: NADP-dependent oxidoreductase [Burkholderiaceae bacterium]|nr:NADP-dependent oxidoreductase [Burkholderiaceae bacterium]